MCLNNSTCSITKAIVDVNPFRDVAQAIGVGRYLKPNGYREWDGPCAFKKALEEIVEDLTERRVELGISVDPAALAEHVIDAAKECGRLAYPAGILQPA